MTVILTNFVPKRREISNVTNALKALVTTTEDHGYEIGQYVRLHVSKSYGMDIQGVLGRILTIPSSTSFTIDTDTSQLEPYVTPSTPPAYTQSHVVPVSGNEDNDTSI